MPICPRLSLTTLVLAVLFVAPAFALNAQFFADTPFSKFSKSDQRHHVAWLRELLQQAADGQSQRWEHGAVGAEAVARELPRREGRRCRELSVQTWHIRLRATHVFNACESKDGKWQLAN